MLKKSNKLLFGVLVLFVIVISQYLILKRTHSSDNISEMFKFDYSLNVDDKNKMIKFITSGTKVSEIIDKIDVLNEQSLSISVLNSKGEIKDDASVINTGDVLVIKNDNQKSEYGLSVIGDTNGDGSVTLIDLVQLRKHIVDWKNSETGVVEKKTGVYLSSIDINDDGDVKLVDLVRVRKLLVEMEEIYSVKLNVAEMTLNVDETKKLEYYVYPDNVSDKSVKWTSSDTNVVTVDAGEVKAVGDGEATITVITNNSGRTASVKVVVKTEKAEYDEAILPTGNEKIEFEEYKDTLKVWIEQITRPYKTPSYVTHIWVKDPYNQFKEQMPDNFGNELLSTEVLLANAVKKNSLENKLAVGVNASGFVLQGAWALDYFAANAGYNKTSATPLVLDGFDQNGNLVIKRDFSGDKPLPWYYAVYGMDKNGDLQHYYYKTKDTVNMTEEEIINWNKQTSVNIQNAGIKYTFAFSPVLVVDGQASATDPAANIRQGFCQIDNNNFVFITDKYTDARNGFSLDEMAKYMISIGCKNGYNLDGGGSATLVYKKSTEEKVTVVWGVNGSRDGNRPVADMIYFHE